MFCNVNCCQRLPTLRARIHTRSLAASGWGPDMPLIICS